MSQWQDPEVCQLCGHDDRRDLRWGLVHWRLAEPGMAYEHVGRCKDERACRQRVSENGEPWPLVEKVSAA